MPGRIHLAFVLKYSLAAEVVVVAARHSVSSILKDDKIRYFVSR